MTYSILQEALLSPKHFGAYGGAILHKSLDHIDTATEG